MEKGGGGSTGERSLAGQGLNKGPAAAGCCAMTVQWARLVGGAGHNEPDSSLEPFQRHRDPCGHAPACPGPSPMGHPLDDKLQRFVWKANASNGGVDKKAVDQSEGERQQPAAFRLPAAQQEILDTDKNDRAGDQRFDDARRQRNKGERREREREGMGQGEACDDAGHGGETPARHDQPEQEEQMVIADQDVVHPEFQEHRERRRSGGGREARAGPSFRRQVHFEHGLIERDRPSRG